MSLLVVDASVALKWVLPEPGRMEAVALLDAFGAGSLHLIAPRLLAEEVASALSKRCRRKEMNARQADEAFQSFDQRRPAFADTKPICDRHSPCP